MDGSRRCRRLWRDFLPVVATLCVLGPVWASGCQDDAPGQAAHVVIVMDEDLGTVDMTTKQYDELLYVDQLTRRIETELRARDIGTHAGANNRYSLFGFGKRAMENQLCRRSVCYANVYSSAENETGVAIEKFGELIAKANSSAHSGSSHLVDSYQAVLEGLDTVQFTASGSVATFIVIVTDQDRTHRYHNLGKRLKRKYVERFLQCQRIAVAMVVDTFFYAEGDGRYNNTSKYYKELLGYDFARKSLVVSQPGASLHRYEVVNGTVSFNSWGNVNSDYIALARVLMASVWDMNAVVKISSQRLDAQLKTSSVAALSVSVAMTVQRLLLESSVQRMSCDQLGMRSQRCVCESYAGAFAEGVCSIPVDCVASEWTDWSSCSVTCNGSTVAGGRVRHRTSVSERLLHGQPCTPLKQRSVCGSLPACNDSDVDGMTASTPLTSVPDTGTRSVTSPPAMSPTVPSVSMTTSVASSTFVIHLPNKTCDGSSVADLTLHVYSSDAMLVRTERLDGGSAGRQVSVELAGEVGKRYTAVVTGDSAEGATCSMAEYTRQYPFQDVCEARTLAGGKEYVWTKRHDNSAVDVVFVLENTRGKRQYHNWVKNYIRTFEQELSSRGIGSDAQLRNLYSVVGFGGFVQPKAMRAVSGNRLLVRYDEVPELIAQLKVGTTGVQDDGYTGLSFAVQTVPFRNSGNTRNVVIFVTDEDRGVETFGGSPDDVVALLKQHDVDLHIVVDTQFSLNGVHNYTHPVIGNGAFGGFQYRPDLQQVMFIGGENIHPHLPFANVADDYIQLVNKISGVTWSILLLSYEDNDQLQAMATGIANAVYRHVNRTRERCLRCVCSHSRSDVATAAAHRRGNRLSFNCLLDTAAAGHRCNCEASESKFSADTMQCRKSLGCVVSVWSGWQECSVTCGNGVQHRHRSVLQQPEAGGARCTGLRETRMCAKKICDVDCEVSSWLPWSQCSLTCGNGTQTRTRVITTHPVADGKQCPALLSSQPCSDRLCDVDCEVSSWLPWSQCSLTCGNGTQTRTRIITKSPVADGNQCPALISSQPCSDRLCVLCEGRYAEDETLMRVVTSSPLPLATDLVFVVDETYSMARVHVWVQGIVGHLDSALQERSVGVSSRLRNRYALVGFGQRESRPLLLRPHHYGNAATGHEFLTSAEFEIVARQNLTNDRLGKIEDGHLAIVYGMEKLQLRDSVRVAKQLVLLTDEDRDVVKPDGENVTKSTVHRLLQQRMALLNVIVDNGFSVHGAVSLGGSRAAAYSIAGDSFSRSRDHDLVVGNGYAGTTRDYVNLALNSGGTSWDVNYVQSHSDAFTAAFVDSLVEQAVEHGMECQNCKCTDDGDSGALRCSRHKHQGHCKCNSRNMQFDKHKYRCR